MTVMANATPWPLYLWESTSVPTVQEIWMEPRAAMDGYGEKKSISPSGDRTPNRPARTKSLYRIRCLDQQSLY